MLTDSEGQESEQDTAGLLVKDRWHWGPSKKDSRGGEVIPRDRCCNHLELLQDMAGTELNRDPGPQHRSGLSSWLLTARQLEGPESKWTKKPNGSH